MAYRRTNARPAMPAPAVRSEDMKDGKTKQEARGARRFHWDRIPMVVFGLAVLGLWWAAGARYTIDGSPLLANEVFNFFHISARLARITDWHWYTYLFWLPLAMSYVERQYAPWKRFAWSVIMLWVVAVWLIVSGADLGSTWLAVTNPRPDDWLIARQVAAIRPIAAVWSLITTFLPEAGMAALVHWLWE